jgi:recombination protein RecR
MGAVPAPLERVIRELVKLPGVGEKTATRLAFFLTRTDRADVDALANALLSLREDLRVCSVCCALAGSDPCSFCADGQRSDEVICVVEEAADLAAVERSGGFRGKYHVLQGTLSPLDGVGPDDLRIAELIRRLSGGQVREVIVATNPTAEGEATAMYLAKLIKPLDVRVSRIAHGLPMGGDVEYADLATLGKALEGRREM